MSEVSGIKFHKKEMAAALQVTKGQEMGMFQYSGSSYVIIFQKLPGKRLIFLNGAGDVYDKRPVLPKGSAGTGGNITLIGNGAATPSYQTGHLQLCINDDLEGEYGLGLTDNEG